MRKAVMLWQPRFKARAKNATQCFFEHVSLSKKMVFSGKISPRIRGRAYSLRKTTNMPYSKIARLCKISKSSAKRLANESLQQAGKKTVSGKKLGRKRLLSVRDERSLKRAIESMRKDNVNFTVKELVHFAGLDYKQASYSTYVRILHEQGYACRQTRRKGILSENDKKVRLQFARKELKRVQDEKDYWTDKIGFYLDGVSFVYKRNPKAEGLSAKGRVWRLRSEGLKITSKGSKNLAGGKRLHFMVAVSFKHGVTLVEQYDKMNGIYFAGFITRNFESCFERSNIIGNQRRLFVMDNDPSQNSTRAKTALRRVKAHLCAIPARSPDINPIENLFHNVKKSLQSQAIENNIVRESFDQFRDRVKEAFRTFNTDIIDKTISSIPNRLKEIIKLRGGRTRY